MKQLKQSKKPHSGHAHTTRRDTDSTVESLPTKATITQATQVVNTMPSYEGPVKGEKPHLCQGTLTDNLRLKPDFKPDKHRHPHHHQTGTLPDQQPPLMHDDGLAANENGENYVRLSIRVRGDRLSVIDSHLVAGPLSQRTSFAGSNAYEVTLNGRLLHADVLPDIGVQRSFPNPTGPISQHGHYITERETFEFIVRVPAHEVTADTIGEIRVTLHRVKEEIRATRLGFEPLVKQFERQLRPIAELVGLPESVLPSEIIARGGKTPTV